MVNWKSLVSRIPASVAVSRKDTYEVLFSKDLKQNVGETRISPHHKQIVIQIGLNNKQTIITYIHELLHAVSETYDVGLTENQILKLEKAFYYILKSGNIFK